MRSDGPCGAYSSETASGRMTKSGAHRPLLTIGITCYNAEGSIERAVDCALAQTWTPREIVIVDDGSTDRSVTLLEELERMHHDIRLIRHGSNRGVAEARNTLLTQSNGTFIGFFDDDDESAPDRLEQQYQRLVEYEVTHPAAPVFCYANREVVQAGGLRPTSQRLGIGRRPPAPSGAMVADYVLGLVKDDGRHCWGMLGSCTLMARTEAFRALGGFDGRFRRCAERDLAVRAALKGAHFISVDAPLVTQYLTLSTDKGSADLQYRLLLVKKHKRYLKEKRSYVGAWCYMHAHFYRGRYWRWGLWYVAALVCFPWDVSRERLKRSSLLARLRQSAARAASS
jgi:glycosyltransferase involved in cell wall biosynthesis